MYHYDHASSRTRFTNNFAQYLIAFCSRPGGASDRDIVSGRFVGPIIPDKRAKFHDPRLNRSGQIQPKAAGCRIYGRFWNFDNCRPKGDGDVISGEALDYVVMDVPAQVGDSRLNRCRIILLLAGRTRDSRLKPSP